MMEELTENLGPEALRDMMEMRVSDGDKFFESSMEALIPVVATLAKYRDFPSAVTTRPRSIGVGSLDPIRPTASRRCSGVPVVF